MEKVVKIILFILLGVGLYLCAFFVLHNDIGYDTDIARDLLVLQDSVIQHKLPLLGPRTGGIDGLFHGPLWYYINLPAFILGDGNPVVIGWFWVLLVICALGAVYFVGKKLGGSLVGLLSSVLVAWITIPFSFVLLNPFGAVILSPLFFYSFYHYVVTKQVRFLMLSLLLVGLMIQFEVAFGGPILVLSVLFLVVFAIKHKVKKHVGALMVLLLPFSTYMLFELRHNFLQTRAVFSHIGTPTAGKRSSVFDLFWNRLDGVQTTLLSTFHASMLLNLLVVLFFCGIFIMVIRQKNIPHRAFYLLFAYFYLGYWPLSFYLNGSVLGFHVLPFLPVSILVLCLSTQFIRKEYVLSLWMVGFILHAMTAYHFISDFSSYTGRDAGSWRFNEQLAKDIFTHPKTPVSFGYYVFTPDEWGYGPRYALQYVQKRYPAVSLTSNTKQETTILVMARAEDGVDNNRKWWIANRVRITQKPIATKNYANGYTVLWYQLDKAQQSVASDPNLVNGLFFR